MKNKKFGKKLMASLYFIVAIITFMTADILAPNHMAQ